jgi:uncharacterized protein (TIGR02246 family)
VAQARTNEAQGGEHETIKMSEDERAIRGLIETWMTASKLGDLPKLQSLMTDDVIFMVPGRPPIGKQGFADAVSGRQGSTMESRAQVKEIEVLGDAAWCRSHLMVTITQPNGKKSTRTGYTLTVLRKQAGTWLIARDANLMTEE